MCPVVKAEKKIEEEVQKALDSRDFDSKKDRRSFKSQEKKKLTTEMSKKLNCNSCTLCKVSEKTENIVVMFEVHGSAQTIQKASKKI